MSILKIATSPAMRKPKCVACSWVNTLDESELAHLQSLLANYTTAALCRQLRLAGVQIGESTLRKHIIAAH